MQLLFPPLQISKKIVKDCYINRVRSSINFQRIYFLIESQFCIYVKTPGWDPWMQNNLGITAQSIELNLQGITYC